MGGKYQHNRVHRQWHYHQDIDPPLPFWKRWSQSLPLLAPGVAVENVITLASFEVVWIHFHITKLNGWYVLADGCLRLRTIPARIAVASGVHEVPIVARYVSISEVLNIRGQNSTIDHVIHLPEIVNASVVRINIGPPSRALRFWHTVHRGFVVEQALGWWVFSILDLALGTALVSTHHSRQNAILGKDLGD